MNYHMSANSIDTQTERINRLKVVLVEQNRTGKWLAEQLGKDPATVSKWCTNAAQPDLYTLHRISDLLSIDIRRLLSSTDINRTFSN